MSMMEPPPTINDDAVLRRLELQYRRAVVKVFCPTRRSGGSDGWTGFVVNTNPCTILTVSHPVRRLHEIENVQQLFHVNFSGDTTNYEAVACKCNFGCDMLVLFCHDVPRVPYFAFANPDVPIVSSTSFFSISHPDQRGWSTLCGKICREPFKIGEHPYYNRDMLIFDHNASLYPGASGAPLVNISGEVIGMQLTQLSRKLNGLCLKGTSQNVSLPNLIKLDDFNHFNWEVKEMSFLRCDLRQAIVVQYMLEGLKKMFPPEVSDPYTTDLNVYLRRSVNRYLSRRGFQGLSLGRGIQPKAKPRDSASGKRPREKSVIGGKGLASLHENRNPKILHRHVEASDILLDYFSKAEAVDPKSTRFCKNNSAKPLVSSSDTEKVYIVRANALSEIDGAIGLLNLGASVRKMDSGHHEEGMKITVVAREEHLEHYSPVQSVEEKDMVALSNNVDAAADDSEDALKCNILEKMKAEEELKALEIKHSNVKRVIEDSDYEIEAMKKKAENLEAEEELKALELKRSSMKKVVENSDYEIEAMKKKAENLEAVFLEESKAPC